MTQTKKRLMVVDTGEIPDYPLDAAERLESHWFMNWHFNRWLNSNFQLTATPEVRAFAFDLFCHSQNQIPVGTLPDDDRQLSALLRLDLAVWQDLRKRDKSPLYNWTECMCDGEIRLMHPVVTEVAVAAFTKKQKNNEDKAQSRERMRAKRLIETIIALGASNIAKDATQVLRVKAWLTANCESGKWTSDWVQQALEAISMRTI